MKPHETFTREELRILRPLDTPRKIQDFLNDMPLNYELGGRTCLSPRRVLRERRAHCMEGAMVAAVAFRLHGERPLVLDLTTIAEDDDHVVALFRRHGHWGAVSKTNHAMLRYRDPVYRTIRELALSYFNEYFLERGGKKTLRSYSPPVDLSRFDRLDWMTTEEHIWEVPEYLADVRHFKLMGRGQITELRPADRIERRASGLTEWQLIKGRPKKRR